MWLQTNVIVDRIAETLLASWPRLGQYSAELLWSDIQAAQHIGDALVE